MMDAYPSDGSVTPVIRAARATMRERCFAADLAREVLARGPDDVDVEALVLLASWIHDGDVAALAALSDARMRVSREFTVSSDEGVGVDLSGHDGAAPAWSQQN